MTLKLLQGSLVRLTAEDPKTLAEPYSRWSQDSECWRLMTSMPPHQYSIRVSEKEFERFLVDSPSEDIFYFNIRTLPEDRLIGDIGLEVVRWSHGEAFVGISIGERENWGKGYGTDAMQVILRYAFLELNLHKVSLSVYSYNPRAVRSYEKAGFRLEGCERQVLLREGQRWDVLFMGILRTEWEMNERNLL
jgi:RimJ/RimL family protein N-acetyltransferase